MTIDNNLTGDCDDFAILIATAIESIGGRTRINFAFNDTTREGHAFTEVYFEDDPQELYNRINYHYQGILESLFDMPKVDKINYRADRLKGYWLNLDYSSKYPGGSYFDYNRCTIFYPKENYYTTE
jgi:hypothetical protein